MLLFDCSSVLTITINIHFITHFIPQWVLFRDDSLLQRERPASKKDDQDPGLTLGQ